MKKLFFVSLFVLGMFAAVPSQAQYYTTTTTTYITYPTPVYYYPVVVATPVYVQPVYVQPVQQVPVYVYPQASWKWKMMPSTQYIDQGAGPVATTVYVGQWVYSY